MINTFSEWSAHLAEHANMSSLRGAAVGFDAADYLDRLEKFNIPDLARPVKEALLPALGGVPFGLKSIIHSTIASFRHNGIKPIFVFSGLDVGKKEPMSSPASESAPIIQTAWSLYDSLDADGAVEHFRQARSVTPEDLFRFLQRILREEGIEFHVAPYGPSAQLAYFYEAKFIDAISGSSEVLLYDVPEVITNWDFKSNEFTWIRRQVCLSELGSIPPDVFIDACILSGTSFMPTFPPLEASAPNKAPKIKPAVDMIMNTGKSGYSTCVQYQDDPACRHLNYLDKYMRAKLSVKHHVVMVKDGKVEPFNANSAPGDIHEFISNRLPDEYYYYLSRGVIGPRVLNWLVSGQISVPPPLDLGESTEYHQLVREQLNSIRGSTLKLLASANHRFYQHHNVTVKCWFDRDSTGPTIEVRNLEDTSPMVSTWNVHEDIYGLEKNKFLGNTGLLGMSIKLLNDKDFYPKTVIRKNPDQLLKTKEEIIFNSLWRMFQVLGYINRDHSLSKWGQVLQATLDALPKMENPSTIIELEEAAVVAVELLRLGLLNANNMFPTYSGAPYRGSEIVKRNTLLVSRVACLGKLSHKEIGYTGPLSRNYLGYHSMVTAVRSTLRDLAEVCLATLLSHGDAVRKREDYTDLGLDLPFLINTDCGLALAVNAYLNDVVGSPNGQKQNVVQHHEKESFKYALNYSGDLQKAFNLWDAVYEGVKAGGDLIKDRKSFDEANKWLGDMKLTP